MALNEARLTGLLVKAFSQPLTKDNTQKVAVEMATAIIAEIRQLEIEYSGGLVVPHGSVTGKIKHTIK